MDWIHLDRDRNKSCALVNMIMNLWIPWNAWHFFPYWGNGSFSRKTLPHDIDWLTLSVEYKLYISLFIRLQQNTRVRQYMHSVLFYIILSPTSSTLIKPSSGRGSSKAYILSTGTQFHVTVQTVYPSSARYGGTRHRLTCSTLHLCVSVCVGHILHRNCLMKDVIEGKVQGRIKVKGRWGRRRKWLLDDIN